MNREELDTMYDALNEHDQPNVITVTPAAWAAFRALQKQEKKARKAKADT